MMANGMIATWQGYNAPFVGGLQGLLSLQADVRLIKNDILQLLLTAPGERVMRPSFGTEVRKLPFEPEDVRTLESVRDSILTALNTYEPRVIVDDVVLSPVPDDNQLNIKIYATLRRDLGINFVVETTLSL